jgi:DNA-binding NarL/FixJ family response regulator
MPEQEGIETIKCLSRDHPEVKVIAMSGAFGGDYLQIAGFMGAHMTLVKPIRVQTVLNAVQDVFADRPPGAEPLTSDQPS